MSKTENLTPVARPKNIPARIGYSEQELRALYALSRTLLINGDHAGAEKVARGLNVVAPDFSEPWLVHALVNLNREDFNSAIFSARQALRINPSLCEAILVLVIAHFNTDDYQTGGTYLGEVADLLRSKKLEHSKDRLNEVKKIYESQLKRFQERIGEKRPKKIAQ